jgi:broad specificity phosphatase PhoE
VQGRDVNVLAEACLATSILLLCAAPTSMSRTGGFGVPAQGLDEPGLRAARGLRLPERFMHEVLCSPWRSAIQTAQAMGLAAQTTPALGDLDPGTWADRRFDTIDPAALAGWIADPLAGAPGGESLHAGKARVGAWLDRSAGASRPIAAVTHPMIVRAALSHALGFPLATTLAIDIAPLSRVTLSYNGKWRLQSLGPH